MRRNILISCLLSLIIGFFVYTPSQSLAVDSEALNTQTRAFAGGADFETVPEDPRSIVAKIINVALGLLGVAFVAYLVYGGFLIMTSGGAEEGVSKGKKIIFTSIIGIIIILSAYSISYFVGKALLEATGVE